MSSRAVRIDTGMSVSFIASAVIHLAVFLLLLWWGQLFSPQMAFQETYYVDVVNLPVATPQSGDSAPSEGEADSLPPDAPSPILLPSVSKSNPKTDAKIVKQTKQKEIAETESAFADRIAKLAIKAEARQYEEKIARMSRKAKSGGNPKSGMPGAGGNQAGSRYADFIKSRLEDALKLTSSYTTIKPEVAVRLTIAEDGTLLRMRIERSSGDATFELAVRRAIDLASKKFTPPPDHAVFENGFVFKPKGISNSVK